ncbi:MAG: SDR family NAD(P)-dependent oxidoreductase [Gammaproteobacteria bacterium]|nr:SDR family NAD(P)-dependent oxidoreductase [Gammaproteobacteria bacterium]
MPQIMVTGATDGIGLETARQLLATKAEVLVHGRSETRATSLSTALNEDRHGGRAIPVWGDLSRMSEVVALASQVRAAGPELNCLITNAGVYERTSALTVDGFERTMAINHLAHHLLTRLLLPLLQAAPHARIVVVSSGTHHSGRLDLTDFTQPKNWSAYGAYSNSKLANLLWTRALAKRLARTDITVNALHPGVIGTKLLRAGFGNGGGLPLSGARTSVYLALDPAVAKVSGRYFVDCRDTKPAQNAMDERAAESLWAESERLLKPFLAGEGLAA